MFAESTMMKETVDKIIEDNRKGIAEGEMLVSIIGMLPPLPDGSDSNTKLVMELMEFKLTQKRELLAKAESIKERLT